MSVPQVAIVGRPNVGKSSIFNWLSGKRIAIVDPTPGVTRDRLTTLFEVGSQYAELVDTGGMGIIDSDNLTDEVEHQITTAIESASVLLFTVDARSGVVPLDEMVAKRLRKVDKPILLLANKCDTPELDVQSAEFHRLGPWPIHTVSAKQQRGRNELVSFLRDNLPESVDAVKKDVSMKLAIVGRRNTGKSTFINALAESDRMIVSEVAGTTRDSVDVRFERDGKTIIAIDTAGVRKKKSLQSDVEFYSLARAERSIRRSDVVLLFLDASLPISQVDKQLASYVLDHHKPAIFVANKWDLLRPMPTEEFGDYLQKVFPSLDYVPISFTTAKTGKNVFKVLNLAQHLYKQSGARVTTGDLNRVLQDALAKQSPPLRQNRRPKIYYATQVGTHPPTIVVFTNGPHLFDATYQRYLVRAFRDAFPFPEVPIKVYFRDRQREEKTEQPEKMEELRPKRKSSSSDEPELWDMD